MSDEEGVKGFPRTELDLVIKEPTLGDRMRSRDGTDRPKHMAVAYMAASGLSHKKIAEDMDLEQSTVSIIISQSEIKAKIHEIQAERFGGSIEKKMRSRVDKAFEVVEGIMDGGKDVKVRDQLTAATWTLEKVTGKATQKVEHQGNVLSSLLDQLDDMRGKGQKDIDGQVEDIEMVSNEDQVLDTWVTGNVPAGSKIGDKGGSEEE